MGKDKEEMTGKELLLSRVGTVGVKKARYTDEEIISMLEKFRGNVHQTAKRLGYHSKYLRRRIHSSELLTDSLREIRERNLDIAEAQLQKHIREENNLQALMYYLNHQGKTRGYGTASIDVLMKAKIEHSADGAMIETLVDKFRDKLLKDSLIEVENEEDKS